MLEACAFPTKTYTEICSIVLLNDRVIFVQVHSRRVNTKRLNIVQTSQHDTVLVKTTCNIIFNTIQL